MPRDLFAEVEQTAPPPMGPRDLFADQDQPLNFPSQEDMTGELLNAGLEPFIPRPVIGIAKAIRKAAQDKDVRDTAAYVRENPREAADLLGQSLVDYTSVLGSGFFDLGDEVAGVASGLYKGVNSLGDPDASFGESFSEGYDSGRQSALDALERTKRRSPTGAIMGQIGAAVLVPFDKAFKAAGLYKNLEPTNLYQLAGRMGLAGGGVGAGYGFGSGNGFSDRMKNAGEMGLWGIGLGAGAPLAAKGILGAFDVGRSVVGAGRNTLSYIGSGVEGLVNPRAGAARDLAKAFVRDTPAGVRPSAHVQDIVKNMKGSNLTLYEAGGPNVVGLGKGVASQPGASSAKAKEAFDQRLATMRDDTKQLVSATAGADGGTVNRTLARRGLNQRDTQRAAQAFGPEDNPILLDPKVYEQTDTMKALLKHPEIEKGLGDAFTRYRLDNPLDNISREQFGLIADPITGTLSFSDKVPFKALHSVKMYLDGLVKKGSSEHNKLRQAFNDELKRINPEYKQFMAKSAGERTLMDATETGRKLLTRRDVPEALTEIAEMSAPQKRATLEGFVRSVFDKIDEAPDTHNISAKVFNNEKSRNFLKALLPGRDINSLIKDLNRRAEAFARVREARGRSDTAATLAAQQSVNRSIGNLLRDFQDSLLQNQERRDAIGEVLFQMTPQQLEALLMPRVKRLGPAQQQRVPNALIETNLNPLAQVGSSTNRIAASQGYQSPTQPKRRQ